MQREWTTKDYQEYYAIRDRVRFGETCCSQGKRQDCVCRWSVTCPVHGLICIGSHD